MEYAWQYIEWLGAFVWTNYITIFVYVMITRHAAGIIKAFKGGNGAFQLDEVSKGLLWILLIVMVNHNINLKVEFSEWVLFLMIFVQIVQAQLQEAIKLFIEFRNGKSPE